MLAHHSPNFGNTCNKSGYNCSLLSKQALREFQPLKSLVLQTIIESMPRKSCHLDPLPTKLLKECIDELLLAILHIVNLSLLNGNFPDELEVACVTPILKSESFDKDDVTNFRPVSNLSFLSNLIEKYVNYQIIECLHANQLFGDFQSSYRCHHSCETALVKVHNDVVSMLA